MLEQLSPLYSSKRKISSAKRKHLMEIKTVIPDDCWPFYDALEWEVTAKEWNREPIYITKLVYLR